MTVDLLLFFILALTAIATALGMLMSRSAVYSALFLVLNFGTVAVFYILLNAPFIAMSQVSVYAGAIMVLFLFVIMLLGTEVLPATKALPWQRPLAFILAVMLAGEASLSALFPKGSHRADPCSRSNRSAVRKRLAWHYSINIFFLSRSHPSCC